MKRVVKYIMLLIGIISTAMGFIGLFIPVLPTTPFLLLASFCFIRSSKRMDAWLMGHKLFGPMIKDYMTNKAITNENRFWALVTLWPTLFITAGITDKFAVQASILIIGAAVTLHLLSLRTVDKKVLTKSVDVTTSARELQRICPSRTND